MSKSTFTKILCCILSCSFLLMASSQTYAESKDARYYFNEGLEQGKKGNYDRAIKLFNKSIDLNPDCHSTYHNLGIVYAQKEEYQIALKYYNKALDINPDFSKAYYQKGKLYEDTNDYDKAISNYSKAIEYDPEHEWACRAYEHRGDVYKSINEYKKAIQDYKKVLELETKDLSVYNKLAWIYATASDHSYRDGEKAVKYAKKARSVKEECWVLDTLAAAYAQNGEFSKAVDTEQKAIEIAKESDSSQDSINTYTKCLKLYKQNEMYDSSKIN